jgi:GTPase Era involved in 16S rRNA processing
MSQSNFAQDQISIAVAGRTNSGKTTLIRTLTRSPIGIVADKANVTTETSPIYFDSLQANFIDTPGFQNLNIIKFSTDIQKNNPKFEMPDEWIEKTSLDKKAIDATRKSNACLYVANLCIPPDNSFEQEITFIRETQPRLLVILNQYSKYKKTKEGNVELVEERIKDWKVLCENIGIKKDHIIIFDVHWDNSSKTNLLYQKVLEVLEENEKEIFKQGLGKFKHRQLEIRRQVYNAFANCLTECQYKISVNNKQFKSKGEDIKKEIKNTINAEIRSFLTQITYIYSISAKHPTASDQEIKLEIQEFKNVQARLGAAADAASLVSGTITVLGALIGGVIEYAYFGGATGGSFAGIGGTAGGAMGSLIGSIVSTGVAYLYKDEDIVDIKLESVLIEDIAKRCLAIIWTISNYCYGRQGQIDDDIKAWEDEKINNLDIDEKPNNWEKATQEELIKYCTDALAVLEQQFGFIV